MKKLILSIVLFLGSINSVFAGGESGDRLISKLYAISNGIKIYSAEGDWSNPDNCQSSEVIVLPSTHESYDTLTSFILSSQARGTKLYAWLSGCYTWGGVSYPSVHGVISYSN